MFSFFKGHPPFLKLKGNVVLGGLFPVHRRSKTTEKSCARLDPNPGYQYLASMLFALEEINNDPSLLPNITLGAEIYDTCRSQTIGVDGAKEIIRYTLSKSNKMSPLVSVIGAFRSDVSVAVANILRVFNIPQISYGSSSPELSNKDIYSYFFRTVPSGAFQAKGMVDLVKRLGWSYVLTVYSTGRFAEKGMEVFYEEAKRAKLCVANKIKLPGFPSEEDFKNVIRELVAARKASVNGEVDVVVLYCIQRDNEGLLRAAKQVLQGEKRFSWVSCNSWGNRDVAKGAEEIGEGALTMDYLGGKVERFKEYLLSRNLKNSQKDVWFKEFWQETLNCDLSNGSSATKFARKCRDNDTLPRNYTIAPVRLVINAVYAVAHALDDMHKNVCPGEIGLCPDMQKIKGEDMLRYLKNTTFPDASYDITVRFNKNQEVDGNYTVRNFRKINGRYRAVQVGTWDGVLTRDQRIEGSLVIDESSIVWGGIGRDGKPYSYCSNTCSNNQRQIRETANPLCCWRCEECGAHGIVINNSCQSCLQGYRPDSEHKCDKLPVVYPTWRDTAAKVLVVLTSVGLLLTLATAVFFSVKREHCVIKAAGRELCAILFTGIVCCHVASLMYFVKPNATVCAVRHFASVVSITMCYAPVVLRTNRIYRIFKSAQSSTVRPPFISPMSQVAAASAIIGVQVAINLVWFLSNRPIAVENYQYADRTLLECDSNNSILGISLSYNVALMLISTIYAFKTRRFPRNFNEAKYIAITMYLSCSVWVIFLPCYFNAKDSVSKTYFSCVTLLLISYTALLGLLMPKVYLVTFGDAKRSAESSSTHTSSDGHRRHSSGWTVNSSTNHKQNQTVEMQSFINNASTFKSEA